MRLHVHEWGDPGKPPLVCLHGISAHGRRFERLAEERWADRFHVLAPDLRGHGRSPHDPPWDVERHLDDLVESVGLTATWIGHSFGGRLVLELAARRPDLVDRAVLLDPAIQILPHVGLDFAEEARRDVSYATVDEAVEARLAVGGATPRAFVEDEMREQLRPTPDGRLRFAFCRSAVVCGYSELCTDPPRPESLHAPALLVHADRFGLVRPDQIETYVAALGDRLTVVSVPGGHVVYWDAYERTAAAIDAFLAA